MKTAIAGPTARLAATGGHTAAMFCATVLVVAACGSGAAASGSTFSGASPPPATPAPSTSAQRPSGSGTTVTLSLKEYSITPATVTLKAGTAVTFEARNDGTINHALLISGSGVNVATKDLAFGPGMTETITATLAAGTYTFICPVDGHASQGMKGTITVTP